jgi:NodT family efflux transporter outer membrane factor (OMF) lipoprotein
MRRTMTNRTAILVASPGAHLRGAGSRGAALRGTCSPGAGLLAACLLGLTACAVGPNSHRPGTPPADSYSPSALPVATASTPGAGGAAQSFSVRQTICAQWWTLFHSPALTALIAQAFAHNPSIDAAVAALRQAQQNVYAQQGFFYPTVQASYSAERNKLPGTSATANTPIYGPNGTVIQPSGPAQPVTYSFHTAQLTVGYAPDLFGLNRRQVQSLRAQADAARFQLQAAYLTLASNVVAAAIQEAATRAQLTAVQAIIQSNQHSLEVLQAQFRLGAVAQLDVSAQESALAQSRALLPPLQKELAQTRDLIRVLAGNAPDHEVPQTFTLASLHLPTDLPLSLPSQLIRQRPDVLAAAAQVQVASAQVGVALANRLPQFAISGAYGGEATQFSQMLSPAGLFWDVIGSATAPLFEGGTLRHRQKAAEQALALAEAQYRSIVLDAFQNVADTLHAIYADADALQAADAAEQSAQVTLDLTQKQLQAGYVSYLSLLGAQQAYEQAAITLVQAQASRLGDTAALFEALGGGWWNR